MEDIPPTIPSGSDKFLDCLRRHMRGRGYAYQTEKTYIHWIKRFILHHNKRHPSQMGAGEIYTHVLGRGAMGVISPIDN
jgi:hypothetical protein